MAFWNHQSSCVSSARDVSAPMNWSYSMVLCTWWHTMGTESDGMSFRIAQHLVHWYVTTTVLQ